MNSVSLLDVRIDDLPVEELVSHIVRLVQQDEKAIVANVNIHAMNLAYESADFRAFLNNCDTVFCDGFGVVLGSQLAGRPVEHRYTPPDWVPMLAQACSDDAFSFYFLGAQPSIAEKAADNLQQLFPLLKIAGTHHGFFDKSPGSPENRSLIAQINEAKPNILFVGFGMPMQEYWLRDNWEQIDANIALPVGAYFDYQAGALRRAPRWMTDNSLEWFGRLFVEPKRLWRRYLVGNPRFMWRVMEQRVRGNSG